MSNKLVAFLMIFLTACSGQQRQIPAPNVENLDAGSIPAIDRDAYQVNIPAVGDVSINLPEIDGAGPNGERARALRADASIVVPYNGVLLNGPAIARISTEYRGIIAQCRIDRQADTDRVSARALRDIELLNTTLSTQRNIYTIMLSSRDREVTRLYTEIQHIQNPPVNVWPYVGIALGSFVLGAGIMTAVLLVNH